MADTKITALTALTAADPANDVIPIVDVSDTSMAASGTTKKISVNNILGASGTATLASAAITGAATVGTTLGVTGASTLASVGVTGAATVGTTLGVTGNLTASQNVYVPASTTYKVGPVAGTWAGLRFDAANAMILDSDTSITFRVNGGTSFSTAGSIDTSGNLNLNTGNVVMATSGKGIDFSATSGTGTSELLNDYEEGTWVPSQGGGLTVVGAFSSSGTYTKVGRLVTITGVVNGATSIAVAATSLLCGNLPFNSATEVTATAVNSTFTAGAFCAINTASFYAVTSIAATPSIRFSATYVAA